MQLCFDATKFGLGLKEAIELASSKNLSAFEYAFEPFTSEESQVDSAEKEYLIEVKQLSLDKKVEIACLRLNYLLDVFDNNSIEHFQHMLGRLREVAILCGCKKVSFALKGSPESNFKVAVQNAIAPLVKDMQKEGLILLLRLSTAQQNIGKSLISWRPLNPQEWRDIIAHCSGLSVSFSPADCLWQSIDYLKILPGMIAAIDHIEANDVEVNRAMLSDSGLFGPLWWRYRPCGKGQVDWKQFIEALKLYEYRGSFSIQFDDEFIDDYRGLEDTLESSQNFLVPLLKY